jgi:hypothetical protein
MPLRGSGAFGEQRNMQWRMVSQHGVQFCVVGGVGARDVERGLDRRMRRKGDAAVQRDVKDKPEIEIDRVGSLTGSALSASKGYPSRSPLA